MACNKHGVETCNCTFVAGDNIRIVGTDPYLITRIPFAQFITDDTSSVDFTGTGLGTEQSPRVVSGDVVITTLIRFADGLLTEVTGTGTTLDPAIVSAWMSCMLCEDPARADGKVLMMRRDGDYHPHVVPVVAQGAVTVGIGLSGDGSAQNPMMLEMCSYDDLAAVCGTP